MRTFHKINLTTLLGLSLCTVAGCSAFDPAGKITVRDLAPIDIVSQTASVSSIDLLEVSAYVTGWVKAPADILIDQDAPALSDHLRSAQWVPSLSYVVAHPSLGTVILDAGLKAGNCEYGLRPVYWVPCQNEAGSDLVSQLITAGVEPNDIRFILPSHFHGDHISGLEDLLQFTDAPIVMTQEALNLLRSPFRFKAGISSGMLAADMQVELLDGHWKEDALLGESYDVFGDGAMKIFKTSGHAEGHISAVLITKSGPILLTFDAAHLQANMDLSVPSGATSSRPQADESLAKLKSLRDIVPNLKVIYGHEPSQWACQSNMDKVNVLGGACVTPPPSIEM